METNVAANGEDIKEENDYREMQLKAEENEMLNRQLRAFRNDINNPLIAWQRANPNIQKFIRDEDLY